MPAAQRARGSLRLVIRAVPLIAQQCARLSDALRKLHSARNRGAAPLCSAPALAHFFLCLLCSAEPHSEQHKQQTTHQHSPTWSENRPCTANAAQCKKQRRNRTHRALVSLSFRGACFGSRTEQLRSPRSAPRVDHSRRRDGMDPSARRAR